MTRRRPAALAALLGAAALLLSGCGFTGLYGVPLPGGKAASGGYQVTAVFDDALDLVPQASVKVADVTVGSVRKIEVTAERKARVVLGIEKRTVLPANAVAVIQQTSLLGEKFVELSPPSGVTAQGRLADGAVIDASHTTTYPDLEQVFGTLSLVLNGGGLERIQTINIEVTKALAGRENRVRDLLVQLDTFVGGLDKQRDQVVRSIEALDRLAHTLDAQRRTIDRALTQLQPGLAVLRDNRARLTGLLTALGDLGKVSSRVINASAANTAANLRDLQPVLQRLQAAGSSLPRSLDLLLDYPFPLAATAGVPGDYTSLFVTLLTQQSVCGLLPSGLPCPLPSGNPLPTGIPLPSGLPVPSGLPLPTPSLPRPSLPGVVPRPSGLPRPPLPLPAPGLPRVGPGTGASPLVGLQSIIGGAAS